MNEELTRKYAWYVSNVISLILLICLSFIWIKAYYQVDSQQSQKIRTLAEAQNYLKNTWEKAYTFSKPIYIPTGIFVQNLTFKSPTEFNIIVYIWQHIPLSMPLSIPRSFFIADQIESDQTKKQIMMFQKKMGDQEIVATYVDAQIRQQFDYKKYPFDDKVLRISIWPRGFHHNVILIPDFASYDLRSTKFPIGVAPTILLQNFKIKDSYFGYKVSDYDTNFGQPDSIDEKGYPYFYLALVLKRSLLTAVVTHVLPLIISFILLFVLLLMNTEKKYRLSRLSFTGTMSISNCTALFFVLVLVHIDLRAKLLSNQVIYLEYFYFLIYLLIALVVANNYILLSDVKKKFGLIHYADNLLPKVLYWPLILSVALIISIKIL